MEYIWCALIGYSVGTINPSYLLGRIKGMDIREKGSGNAGGSNALIVFGKIAGVLCSLFDIAKAFTAVRLAEFLFPNFSQAFSVTGCAVILGHIFPFYMKFRGGKGLACLGGVVLSYDWLLFLIMLAAAVVLTLVTDYICFVAPTAAVSFVVIYAWQTRNFIGSAILAIAAALICGKHVRNFKRIREGTEARFSYIRHPEKEIARISKKPEESEPAQ
ncbi:MAG: glycerol-3-phosphate acyltransferase [Clostridia bacterium]|nr:glycerol-3-phosphate acyltransferase [Clostridia bacterium]